MTSRDYGEYERQLQQQGWEDAIRPFTKNPPQWKIGRPEQPQNTDEPVLEWEAIADVQVFKPESLGFQTRESEAEVERVVSEKRVENSEDANQFVDVEVIDRISFRRQNGSVVEMALDNNE